MPSTALMFASLLAHPRSLPLSRTAWPYFCSLVINASPCLTTSVYCLFLSSGRLVSIMLLTRSMVQGMRSAAMNLARSLNSSQPASLTVGKGGRTDQESQQISQRLSPCFPTPPPDNSAEVADIPVTSSHERTTLYARRDTDLD